MAWGCNMRERVKEKKVQMDCWNERDARERNNDTTDKR